MISLESIRGLGRSFKKIVEIRIPKLARIWARRICSRHNKDIKLFIVGPQGSGKSRSAIHLAIRLSEEVSAIVGGKPEDYFPLDLSHVFIGDPEAHAEALKNIKKHCIYILDDAGVSINARNFMTSYNKSLNDIFQTVRTDNAVIIINAPDSFLIDNVPRTLVSHYAEVSESQHSLGFNLLKVFKLERKFREGHTHYHHYQFGNCQVVRWKFGDIPDVVSKLYEVKRDAATQTIKSHAGQSKQDRAAGKRESAAQKKEDGFMKVYELVTTLGYTGQKALSQVNKETGLNLGRASYSNWLIKKGFIE
jgi:energy-coupling factor transporter ATP-binding protein EcfA2